MFVLSDISTPKTQANIFTLAPGFLHFLQSGGRRIRTSDTFRYTRFPSERTRPLCDASALTKMGTHYCDASNAHQRIPRNHHLAKKKGHPRVPMTIVAVDPADIG